MRIGEQVTRRSVYLYVFGICLCVTNTFLAFSNVWFLVPEKMEAIITFMNIGVKVNKHW